MVHELASLAFTIPFSFSGEVDEPSSRNLEAAWDLKLIAAFKDNGILNEEMDALIVRRLLTKACTSVLLRSNLYSKPNFSAGIKLVDFLKELIAKGFIADVLSCTSNLDMYHSKRPSRRRMYVSPTGSRGLTYR